jgi:hypothetical protein
LLSHVVTVAGIAALIYGAYLAVVATKTTSERIIRGMALTAGSFAYFLSKALGLSLPELVMDSVQAGNLISFVTIATLMPALAGYLLIRYIMVCMKRHDAIAIRVMLMLSALVLVMFADVYIAAAGQAKTSDLRALAPNMSFLLTILCSSAARWSPAVPRAPRRRLGLCPSQVAGHPALRNGIT